MVISELKRNDVTDRINRTGPDIILAIGRDALVKVKSVRDIPVIYLMVLYPRSILSDEENIFGVSMNNSQEQLLNTLTNALPGVKNVGLVYDPAFTGHLVERAREAAGLAGVNLIARKIDHAGEAPMAIRSMEGKIDILWMLPDRTVMKDETVETMFLFSIENKTPVLTFSEKYLDLGALMSIGVDPFDMGRQAGETAQSLLSKKGYEGVKEKDARKEVIIINMKTARKIGITLREEILASARVIE